MGPDATFDTSPDGAGGSRARGTLRPVQLTPPRARISGLLAMRLFQLGDLTGLSVTSLVVHFTIHDAARTSFLVLAPMVGLVSLVAFDLYRFERHFRPVSHLGTMALAIMSGVAFMAGVVGTFAK